MSQRIHHTSSPQKVLVPWWVILCRLLWRCCLFLGSTVFLGLAINILSTWFISPGNTLPSNTPLAFLFISWPITVLSGCCFLLISALIWLASRWKTPTREQQKSSFTQDRARLLRRLRLRYEQLLAQSLTEVVRLELALASRPTAIQNMMSLSLRLPEQPDTLLPPHSSLFDAYEQAHQELLLLGEPGAGKSTLLLELAHQLLLRAEEDILHPLPVLLPLASWATDRRPLEEWLEEQIALLYTLSSELSQQGIQERLFLPLLDGLDEMEDSARPACIAAINAYHRASLGPLVVCSRTQEYTQATKGEQLALHAAIIVLPLSLEQVEQHLLAIGKPVAGLRSALRKSSELQDLIRTPLLLQILILTYQGTPIRGLPQKEAQLRQHIWVDYVGRMIVRKGDIHRYSHKRTMDWLGWLAQKMRIHNQAIFYLEALQADWLPHHRRHWYLWTQKLVFGVLIGFVLAGLFLFMTHQPSAISIGLLIGITVGFAGKTTEIQLVSIVSWSWENLKNGFICALFFGSIFSLLLWKLAPLYHLTNGVLFGILGGCTGQISIKWLLKKRQDLPLWVTQDLFLLLLFGMGAGLPIWFYFGLRNGVLAALISAVLVGLLGPLLPSIQRGTPTPFWLKKRTWRYGIIGLLGGILGGTLTSLIFGTLNGIFLGTLLGTFFIGVAWIGMDVEVQQIAFTSWTKRLWQGLLTGCLFGILSSFITQLLSGLVFGLLLGSLFVFLTGISGKELPSRLILTPNEGVRRSIKNMLLLLSSVGILSGICFGLFLGITGGFYFGIICGLLTAIIAGLGAFVQHYTLRFWLWQTNSFPWNTVSFLEDARARVLLTRIGGGYSFAHRLLLDYFADDYTTRSSFTTPTNPTPSSSPKDEPSSPL